ncbi:hypothetical protein ACIGDI_03980 [Streptomyces sp. NPDC085900]|uniref:hypothetical protein n=1 Tax=Streptomyces sp. NPDC085900 TaxID=3365737 RepID=UPI0037D348F5
MDRYEVHISDEGLAAIDGEPLVPAPGQSLHEAVLDRLQRYAAERAEAVEATVNDSPDTSHFVLEVSPDGSSRVLTSTGTPEFDGETEDEADPEGEPEPDADVEPEADTESEAEPVPVADPAPEPEPSPEAVSRDDVADPTPVPRLPKPPTALGSAVATAVARATAAARAAAEGRAAAPNLATPSLPTVVLPADLAGPVGRIHALATVGRLEEAHLLANRLRESLTEEAGAEDPRAVEARAVEAYVAHLRGDHREATVLALAVARIRCRTGDRRAAEEVARAAAAWQRIDDDRAAVAHGRELLHMWDRLHLRGLLASEDAELADRVRRRVDALESAYV